MNGPRKPGTVKSVWLRRAGYDAETDQECEEYSYRPTSPLKTARLRKAKKPIESVIIVTNTLDATAGS